MVTNHKYALYWLSYIVIVLVTVAAVVYSGLMKTIWNYDVTYLSSIIFFIWVITEVVGGYQILKLDRQVTTMVNRDELSQTINSIFAQHRFVNFMSEVIVTLGIFGTVLGVILALMPFFGMTSFDPSALQPQLLKMFAGIAVAFFPTAISILIKIFLDFNARLHELAVLDLNNRLQHESD
jgi:hypothetical protein